MHQHAFRDLQLELPWPDAMAVQQRPNLLYKITFTQLACAHVNGDTQVCRERVGSPDFQCAAGLGQHPMPDGENQPGFLGQPDEVERGDTRPRRGLFQRTRASTPVQRPCGSTCGW